MFRCLPNREWEDQGVVPHLGSPILGTIQSVREVYAQEDADVMEWRVYHSFCGDFQGLENEYCVERHYGFWNNCQTYTWWLLWQNSSYGFLIIYATLLLLQLQTAPVLLFRIYNASAGRLMDVFDWLNCWAGTRPPTGDSSKPLDWKVRAWAERLVALVSRGLTARGRFTIRQAYAASLSYGGRTELAVHNPQTTRVSRSMLITAPRESGESALQFGTVLADIALADPDCLLQLLKMFKCKVCGEAISCRVQGRLYGAPNCPSCHSWNVPSSADMLEVAESLATFLELHAREDLDAFTVLRPCSADLESAMAKTWKILQSHVSFTWPDAHLLSSHATEGQLNFEIQDSCPGEIEVPIVNFALLRENGHSICQALQDATALVNGYCVPVGGTGIAALRYGSTTYPLGKRVNHVDGDPDFVLLVDSMDKKQSVVEYLRNRLPGFQIHWRHSGLALIVKPRL